MKVIKLVCTAIVFCLLCGLLVPQTIWADGGKPHPGATKYVVYSGQFTAVDVTRSSVTLAGKNGEARTVAITGETKIEVNGKAATLADVQVGMYGGVKVAAGGNTAIMLKASTAGAAAKYVITSGRFTAVNVAQSTVTLTNKNGEARTVTVAANASIEVDGKAATLADVQVGMYGGVKVAAGGNAAIMLRAQSPG